MGMILVTASVAVFVWAVVGLIRPTWARLPSRAASVGVWVLSVVLFIIGGALMPDSTPEQTEQSAAPGSHLAASGNLTAAQRNAVRSANSYLQMSGFSRQGLIDQLSSEFGDSYSVGDATVAVNSLSTDWNAQAARAAVSYLELSGFSCRGLIDQLSSEDGDKYTVEQATYGATQAGICIGGALMPDSTPEQTEQSAALGSHLAASGNLTAAQRNAVRSANSYLQMSGFSRQGLIDQLSSEFGDSYSVGDATVAVNSLSTDWNAQAARSAVSYLELSGFSCRGLIDQLSSESGNKYTVEQATYGATQAGIC